MPFGLLVEVTCVISTSDTPLVTRSSFPPVPHSAAPMFWNSTFVTRMWLARRGSGRPLVPASAALIAIPLAASRTMLLLNVTYSVTHQVQRPS